MTRLALLFTVFLALSVFCSAQQVPPDQAANNMKMETLNQRLQGAHIQVTDVQTKPGGRMVDVMQLQKQTDELNALIKAVNVDLANVRKGILAADLTQKLKRIEKLSKDLRHTFE